MDDHRGAQVGLQLGRGAFGDDPAVVDHHDVAGQAVGLLEVLGGEQHGGALGHQSLDDPPQVLAALGVEPGGRLVEEEDRRPGRPGRRPGRAGAACRPSRS